MPPIGRDPAYTKRYKPLGNAKTMDKEQSAHKSKSFWPKVDSGFTSVAKAIAVLAGIAILTMVFLSLKELVMRNLGMPGSWAGEAIELLVMWTFLLPMAYSQLDGAMIRVTLLTDKLSPKAQVGFVVLSAVSAIVFGLLLLDASYGFFANTAPGAYYPETGFPTIIQRGCVPACALLLAFSGLICTVRAIKGLKNPERFLASLEGGE
jgi:TRAP-type C4-dicarboxylate transport system permease small subunit